MNKTFLIYVLFCIFLIGSVSALEFNLKEQVSDVSSLEASFGTRDTELIKAEVFTDLKSNDALKKESVFSMDTSKFDFDFNRDIDVVFNEVCGKVTGFRISELKDGDYLVKADIENAFCSDGTYGYKIDWMPKLKIGENELINTKWEWWNYTWNVGSYNTLNYTNETLTYNWASSGITGSGETFEIITSSPYSLINITNITMQFGRFGGVWGGSYINLTIAYGNNTESGIPVTDVCSVKRITGGDAEITGNYTNPNNITFNFTSCILNSSTWYIVYINSDGTTQRLITAGVIGDVFQGYMIDGQIGSWNSHFNYDVKMKIDYYWYGTTTPNITISLISPDGVLGELSSIVLNLSKGVNQSYTNADLVYNGVVYASPTQTEYTNYTLFTQSITNSAIGNFSYYFNVSLTDYGHVFNFSTVNGSHLVTELSLNLSYFDTSLASMNGKNVTLTLIGDVSGNYSTSTGLLDISNLSTGDYTLLSSSTGYVQNSYLLTLNSSGFSPLSLYLQPINVTYYGLVTVKDKYSKDTISGATLTIQRYINNAWVTEQIYTTDFNGQAQGYFVIDTQFYNFLVSIGSNTYFGVINSNANKKVIYAQDITNGMIIEIDTQQGNSYYEFISSEYVSTSLNFTNTSNTTGYFTFRWIDPNGNSRNGTLNVYVNNVLNCTNSAVSSSGIITCSVSAGSPTYFLGGGYIDGVGINSYLAKLGVFNEFSLDWGAFGWIMSIFLVIIGYFAFSSIPSMSLLVGTGIFALMSILNLVFKGINPLMFIGFMAVAFLLAKIPSRQGGNG